MKRKFQATQMPSSTICITLSDYLDRLNSSFDLKKANYFINRIEAKSVVEQRPKLNAYDLQILNIYYIQDLLILPIILPSYSIID